MRIFVALVLGGLLAMGCSDDGNQGNGGNGGTAGTGGMAGNGGAGGAGDGSPTITEVTSTPNQGCAVGVPGVYTIEVTATDAEDAAQDLSYTGSPPTGCSWAVGSNNMFDGDVAMWNCPNAVDYPGAVVIVTDTDNNTDEVMFTVAVCQVVTVP